MKDQRKVLIPRKCLNIWTKDLIRGVDRNSVFLVLGELTRRSEESRQQNGKMTWIPMNREIWVRESSVWDEKFKQVKEILEEEGVMDVSPNYRLGSSRKYLLKSAFRQFTLVNVEVFRRSTKKSEIPKDPNLKWISKSLTKTTLPLSDSVLHRPYITLISEELRSNQVRLTESSMGQKLRSDYRTRNVVWKERVFHPVCNLPKLYRHQLKIDGEDTVEIDISSSHFVLLLGVVKSEGIRTRLPIGRWITSGKFYEELNTLVWGGTLDRETVKRLCIKFLDSGSKGRLGNSFVDLRKTNPDISLRFKELRTFFRTNEPELTRFIDTENDKKVQTMNSQHQTVGGLLYRLMMKEVEVVIEGIVKWCRQNQIPIISVHDGVIVKQSDFKTRKLKSEFTKIVFNNVGVRPHLKVV